MPSVLDTAVTDRSGVVNVLRAGTATDAPISSKPESVKALAGEVKALSGASILVGSGFAPASGATAPIRIVDLPNAQKHQPEVIAYDINGEMRVLTTKTPSPDYVFTVAGIGDRGSAETGRIRRWSASPTTTTVDFSPATSAEYALDVEESYVQVDSHRFPLLAKALADGRVEGFSRPNTGWREYSESAPEQPLSENEQIRFGRAGDPGEDFERRAPGGRLK